MYASEKKQRNEQKGNEARRQAAHLRLLLFVALSTLGSFSESLGLKADFSDSREFIEDEYLCTSFSASACEVRGIYCYAF